MMNSSDAPHPARPSSCTSPPPKRARLEQLAPSSRGTDPRLPVGSTAEELHDGLAYTRCPSLSNMWVAEDRAAVANVSEEEGPDSDASDWMFSFTLDQGQDRSDKDGWLRANDKTTRAFFRAQCPSKEQASELKVIPNIWLLVVRAALFPSLSRI